MWWMLAVALAAPPEGLVADEADQWIDAWSVIQDGPPGCWEVVGTASWNWDAGRLGGARGDSAFIGRLEDGVWRDFVVRSMGEERREPKQRVSHRQYPHDELRFVPLVGRRTGSAYDDDEDDDAGENVLSAVFDELGTDVDFSSSRWNDEAKGVVLTRVIPLSTGPDAEMDVFFPDGGQLPTRADIRFPDAFGVPRMRIAKVYDAKARIRGSAQHGTVFPRAETFSFSAGLLGFRLYGAQSISYKQFRPCVAAD